MGMKVEIWVPMLGDGSEDDPYRPDIPRGLAWSSDEGAPTDFLSADFRPATTCFNIIVDEEDVPKCTKRIPIADIPEKDSLVVEMIRECRGDWEQNVSGFFDKIEDIGAAGPERKRMIKDALLQAVARGVSAAKAEAIRRKHDLPEGKAPNGQ